MDLWSKKNLNRRLHPQQVERLPRRRLLPDSGECACCTQFSTSVHMISILRWRAIGQRSFNLASACFWGKRPYGSRRNVASALQNSCSSCTEYIGSSKGLQTDILRHPNLSESDTISCNFATFSVRVKSWLVRGVHGGDLVACRSLLQGFVQLRVCNRPRFLDWQETKQILRLTKWKHAKCRITQSRQFSIFCDSPLAPEPETACVVPSFTFPAALAVESNFPQEFSRQLAILCLSMQVHVL